MESRPPCKGRPVSIWAAYGGPGPPSEICPIVPLRGGFYNWGALEQNPGETDTEGR